MQYIREFETFEVEETHYIKNAPTIKKLHRSELTFN
jgi:hypothetical protein